jgi:hypothetical protein
MKFKLTKAIARNIRDMVEASSAIQNIDESKERYMNHVMEARSRYTETVDKAELAIADLLNTLLNSDEK